ncbi:putative reticulon-like protein B8-like [Capsicum annuum]|uniref:WD repeat-containing protein 26 homolog n=1 Tax=Capsicum annuum TaxID=4072 RepID=UPI001FB07ED3|nr:WD repeat-containing protein 26 homolog [Capsicum annuum]KAF3661475.1 putative reticulon-like protein B8-like [Capsicum annuum]
MGGSEDDEPLSKRVKVSFRESADPSNGTFLRDPASCSLSDSMVRPLEFQRDGEVVGTKGVKKVEFVRIIAEALYSLGYKKAGAQLEEESGIPLHPSLVNLFIQQILDGRWDESIVTLHKIGLVDEKIVKLASFAILEQKFLELLEGNEITLALKTLRTEIAPLFININRVANLSLCLLSHSKQDVSRTSGLADIMFIKQRTKLLEELQRLLPITVMIPQKRLIHLVEQGLELQKESCLLHNSVVTAMSLLTDHQCGIDQIPSKTLQILQGHTDEIWFLQFSHNGKYLASSSADCSVILWEVKLDGRLCLKHRLSGHEEAVSFMSWAPDDNYLLTCGVEEVVRLWDVNSGECMHLYQKNGLGLTSCGWAPDGKRVYCGVTDKSISMWDLEGKELASWKGHRINRIADLGITSDGKYMISVCKNNMILLFGLESKSEQIIIEDEAITSFALSADNKHILVSLRNKEIHLWSIEGNAKLLAVYQGHKLERFVVRSCFGGLNQAFIASGSEDSQVYIWHRSTQQILGKLAGHSGTVNCVSWNPANPHMLASASDDGTIRIWGLDRANVKHNGDGAVSNGVNHCNGGT